MDETTIKIHCVRDFYVINYYPQRGDDKYYYVHFRGDVRDEIYKAIKNSTDKTSSLNFKLKSTGEERLSPRELSQLRENLEDRFPGTMFNLTPAVRKKLASQDPFK